MKRVGSSLWSCVGSVLFYLDSQKFLLNSLKADFKVHYLKSLRADFKAHQLKSLRVDFKAHQLKSLRADFKAQQLKSPRSDFKAHQLKSLRADFKAHHLKSARLFQMKLIQFLLITFKSVFLILDTFWYSLNFSPRKLDINDATQTTVTKPFDSPKNRDIDEGSSIDFTQLNDYTIPVGLRNLGVNVCFFKSVIQICALPKFRVYLQNNFHRNDDIKIINTLVHDVICANQPKSTYLCCKAEYS